MNSKQALAIIRKIRGIYNTANTDWDNTRQIPAGHKIKQLRFVKKGMKILDLGCGNGLMFPELLKHGSTVVGFDISSSMLNLARKKFKNEIKDKKIKLILGSATKLPFKNNSFDGAVSFAVLHHIPSNELRLKFLQELWRVLKPKSTAVVVVWNLLNEWSDKRFKITEQLKTTGEPGDVLVPWKATKGKILMRYMHQFSKKELSSLAHQAGFKKITINYFTSAGIKQKNGEAMVLKMVK